MNFFRPLTLCLCAAALAPTAALSEDGKFEIFDSNISVAEVLKTQRAWCNALLEISRDYRTGGISKAKATAARVIDTAYAYQYGPVAFKPTLTYGEQTFRISREGALAYFVGHNPNYPSDTGFALKPWGSCAIDNKVIQLNGSSAITMGNVKLTTLTGKVTTVDKTWSFLRESDGQVRIVLHHSSLPYEL